MSDSGVAVVAPVPSEQQQQSQHQQQVPMDQDKMDPIITDSKIMAHKIVASAAQLPPIQPSLPPTESGDEGITNHLADNILYDKNNSSPTKNLETADIANIKVEQVSDQTTKLGDVTIESGCSSGADQKEVEVKQPSALDTTTKTVSSEQTVKKKRKIDETIIDGFAISAFKSWEELQDEMNERIASNLMKKRAAEMAAVKTTGNNDNSNEIAKKMKKSKIKQSAKNSQSGTSGNSSSLLLQPKADKVEKIKKDSNTPVKRTPDGQSSKTADPKSSSKKQKASKKSKENSSEGTSMRPQETSDRESNHSYKRFKEDFQKTPNDSNNHDIPSRSVDNIRNGSPHASQSPQVHNIRNHLDQTSVSEAPQPRVPQPPVTPQRILAQDLLRDPHAIANSQSAQYSPYSSNPHLNHLYNVTSNIQHSMQAPPFGHHHNQSGSKSSSDQSKVPQQQNSQSQQHASKQSAPVPTSAQQSPHPSQQQPYQPGPSMHHNLSMGSMNQSHPFYNQPMHTPGANPYLYHHQHANMAQQNSSIPPHLGPQTQSTPHNPYPQPPPPQNHHHYPGYLSHGAHPPPPSMPPFGMYPPHMSQQPPQTNSMMASMSMSQLPNPYGSPYIVNETTISRQTSIIPPPITAFEHVAAANRFAQHPMLPPMGTYNPAVAQSQRHHNNPSSLYPTAASSLSSAERSFMDLARSYNAASAAAAAAVAPAGQLANYPSLINSPAAYPPATSTSSAYSLDRWPTKMAIEHHQRAVSRYSSLYPNAGGYPTRPPTFPAGLFPPPF